MLAYVAMVLTGERTPRKCSVMAQACTEHGRGYLSLYGRRRSGCSGASHDPDRRTYALKIVVRKDRSRMLSGDERRETDAEDI